MSCLPPAGAATMSCARWTPRHTVCRQTRPPGGCPAGDPTRPPGGTGSASGSPYRPIRCGPGSWTPSAFPAGDQRPVPPPWRWACRRHCRPGSSGSAGSSAGGRQPHRAHPRHHRPPHHGLDSATCPQPAHGPRSTQPASATCCATATAGTPTPRRTAARLDLGGHRQSRYQQAPRRGRQTCPGPRPGEPANRRVRLGGASDRLRARCVRPTARRNSAPRPGPDRRSRWRGGRRPPGAGRRGSSGSGRSRRGSRWPW